MSAPFQVCVLTFQTANVAGPSTQTVTGVVDQYGHSFAGQQFLFFGSGSPINTILSAGGSEFVSAYHIGWGTDNLTTRQSGQSTDEVYSFAAKILSGSTGGANGCSVISNFATIGGGGTTTIAGSVSASRVGEFDITYTVNNTADEFFIVVILAGDDLTLDTGYGAPSGANPTVTTVNSPSAILFGLEGNGGGGVSTSAGGFPFSMGFANLQPDTSLAQGAISTHPINQAGNTRYQNSHCYARIGLSMGTPVLLQDRTALAIGAHSFQVNGTGDFGAQWISIGGVQAASGVLTKPGSTGHQTIDTGIQNQIILFLSTGTTASASIATDLAQVAIGVIDAKGRQAAYWSAEDVVGNGTPVHGARTVRNDATLVFATPAAASTTISSRANLVGILGTTFTLDWTVVDGTSRQVLWLALGAPNPPPPAGTVRTFRRVRRFPIAFENNLWIFLSRLEVLCQQGVGTTTGQGSAPLVMFRLSTDGGSTFGNEIQMSLGAVGQYDFRTYVNRLGRGRNLVGEISCSDPVFWAVLDAFCDYTVGSS